MRILGNKVAREDGSGLIFQSTPRTRALRMSCGVLQCVDTGMG